MAKDGGKGEGGLGVRAQTLPCGLDLWPRIGIRTRLWFWYIPTRIRGGCFSPRHGLPVLESHTHTHTHTYQYPYIHISIYIFLSRNNNNTSRHLSEMCRLQTFTCVFCIPARGLHVPWTSPPTPPTSAASMYSRVAALKGVRPDIIIQETNAGHSALRVMAGDGLTISISPNNHSRMWDCGDMCRGSVTWPSAVGCASSRRIHAPVRLLCSLQVRGERDSSAQLPFSPFPLSPFSVSVLGDLFCSDRFCTAQILPDSAVAGTAASATSPARINFNPLPCQAALAPLSPAKSPDHVDPPREGPLQGRKRKKTPPQDGTKTSSASHTPRSN